jgi:hypothetical protein
VRSGWRRASGPWSLVRISFAGEIGHRPILATRLASVEAEAQIILGEAVVMGDSGTRARASARHGWLVTVAFAASVVGCFPAHHEKPDAGEPGDAGTPGMPGQVGDGGGSPSACADAAAPDVGGGRTGPPCTNACSRGTTRCSSATTLEECVTGANGCTSFVASTCGTGTVCERTSPPACIDPEWAEWPVPNAASDVGRGAPNLATLVDNQDGTITDKVTGLMWEQDFHRTVYPTGAEFCAGLTTGGHADWRMPTIIELISIADFSRDTPAIDTEIFPLGIGAGFFWSSTVRAGFGSSVDMLDYFYPFVENSGGFDGPGQPGEQVRCVR